MKDIIENMALINLNNFGKENKIDISNTHLVKNGRGFKYSLVKNSDGLAILTICFHKMSVPTYHIINSL